MTATAIKSRADRSKSEGFMNMLKVLEAEAAAYRERAKPLLEKLRPSVADEGTGRGLIAQAERVEARIKALRQATPDELVTPGFSGI